MKQRFATLAAALLLTASGPAQSPQRVAAPMADVNQVVDNTLDSLHLARTARPEAGSTRKGSNPVLFLVGNSTMRTGTLGNGNNGQWGWGYFAPEYFDEERITVENHALGGTSSRTFYNRLWPDVVKGVRKGDWVVIELGHNDNGPYDSGRARASIPGIGRDSLRVTIQETGVEETVYTYGEYMRRFVREVKARGGHPILVSLTPRNAWVDADSTQIVRVHETFGLWAKQVARQERIPFIDLNEITAQKFERFGKAKVQTMFYLDRIHTSEFGARVNAASFAEGLHAAKGVALANYLKPVEPDTVTGASRKAGCPVLFVAGDSTVKNADSDDEGMWGWGSLLGELFDPDRITVENHAKAGRSARTFLDEGRWDKIYNALQPGDFVLIQFGHNDLGDIETGKARGELPGSGPESRVFRMEKTGRYQVVYTYGWYLRKFILDAREKGAIPIVLSHTPRNKWDNGRIERNTDTFGRWTREAAEQAGAWFIDLNRITADKLEAIGLREGLHPVNAYFKQDHTHTSKAGARLHAAGIAEGLRETDCPLKDFLSASRRETSALSAAPALGQPAADRAAAVPPSPLLFGEAELFNDGWRFTLSDPADGAAVACDDAAWRTLDLPHDWSVEAIPSPSLASCTGYLPGGIAWYRKTFIHSPRLESDRRLEKCYIYFEGIYNRSEVFLNGHLLGKRPNGYISFAYDLTPYLQEGENVLAVRVDHSRYADSRWYTGSGIYRDVWIVRAPETHLAQWGTAYRLTGIDNRSATVEVTTSVERADDDRRPLELRATVLNAEGRPVATRKTLLPTPQTSSSSQTSQISQTSQAPQTLLIKIPAPHRWELDNPYLYTLQVDLCADGRRIDGCHTRMGLRTLAFDPDRGFLLNGKERKVKGVCLHHDAGTLGAAVPPEVWRRRLENLKAIGTNAIRMSHNPQAPALYDLCDELGFLVMDEGSDEWEFPKRKWLEGWNVGTPGFEGSYDFFEEWIDRDVADMVRRDRNHPSVFLWSVGNEVDYPNDPYSHPVLDSVRIAQPNYRGYDPDAPDARRIGRIAERLAAVIKHYDTSRPTTGAMAGVAMSNATSYPDAIDVCGYNYTEQRYDLDHATYPRRVIYGSENSSSYDAWRAVCERDFIFGQFIWTGIDYLGESRRWPSRGFYSGLLDFGGFVKPRGRFRASLWSDRPVTYIGTYPVDDRPLSTDAWDDWNYDAGDTIRVVCYTNSPQARLLLDGAVVGAAKPYDTATGIIHWDIPYRAGELRAEGLDAEGRVASDYTIRTSGRPYALRVTADRTTLPADRAVCHLTIEVVDRQGIPVTLADNEITCEVTGPARLLGLENADNRDMTDQTDNVHRAFRGRLLAYIQTTGDAGPISIRCKAPLLQGCRITLQSN